MAPHPQVQPCRYKVGKTLGAGSYSVVKECVHIDTGRCYAAKVINKRLMAGREHMIRNEIAVLKKVSMGHKNILTLVDYFETMNNLYLVTDLALGGELFDRICRKGSYYESDAAGLIRATLSAVAYLHDHGIVHRDLKPENLLFRTPEDNADLLIADFGLSRVMDEEQFHVLTTTCGTPGYMAPEIFKKTGHGKPVDLWALGVITYFLLCGYTPFDRDNDFEEMQAILKADYSFTPVDYWCNVSDAAKDFIRRCLTIDPARRMTAHEALQHPFLAGWDRQRLLLLQQQQQEQLGSAGLSTETGGFAGSAEGVFPVASAGAAVSGGAATAVSGMPAATNLLPTVKKNFNARRTLHAAIDTVRAINKLREGSASAAVADHTADGGMAQAAAQATQAAQAARKSNQTLLAEGYAAARGVPGPGVGFALQALPRGPGGDTPMDDAPQLPNMNAVPMSLRPGMEVNKVMETAKGLWTGVGNRG